jgi:hypothetical protein
MRGQAQAKIKPSVRWAAKIREAGRRACREYCKELPPPTRWPCLLLPCWKCEYHKGGTDCQGNQIGTRDARIAAARAAVMELSMYVKSAETHKQQTEAEVGEQEGRRA